MSKNKKIINIEPFVVTECEVQRGNNIYNDTVLVTSNIAKGRKRFGYVTSDQEEGAFSLEKSLQPVQEKVKVLKVRGCTFKIEATLSGMYQISNESKQSNRSFFNPDV